MNAASFFLGAVSGVALVAMLLYLLVVRPARRD